MHMRSKPRGSDTSNLKTSNHRLSGGHLITKGPYASLHLVEFLYQNVRLVLRLPQGGTNLPNGLFFMKQLGRKLICGCSSSNKFVVNLRLSSFALNLLNTASFRKDNLQLLAMIRQVLSGKLCKSPKRGQNALLFCQKSLIRSTLHKRAQLHRATRRLSLKMDLIR
ncbi:hypothetical protein LIER_15585 [Lithospermum erythrorhizon]|uniref:Uncharacterized protein n=1 Tax=Lithospermum erythrorhizon TaxID=34254 RepID=A0AAV3Q637_LITER